MLLPGHTGGLDVAAEVAGQDQRHRELVALLERLAQLRATARDAQHRRRQVVELVAREPPVLFAGAVLANEAVHHQADRLQRAAHGVERELSPAVVGRDLVDERRVEVDVTQVRFGATGAVNAELERAHDARRNALDRPPRRPDRFAGTGGVLGGSSTSWCSSSTGGGAGGAIDVALARDTLEVTGAVTFRAGSSGVARAGVILTVASGSSSPAPPPAGAR